MMHNGTGRRRYRVGKIPYRLYSTLHSTAHILKETNLVKFDLEIKFLSLPQYYVHIVILLNQFTYLPFS